MTEPLTPADCDLRFMPIDIGRLFGSEFHAQSDDAAWRAGLTLWFKSYHQVPAASLPDDEIALARLAELGRDTKTWRKIRTAALRNWVKCSDGRLYHPVVAEKALEGWIQKLTQRKVSGAGNAKRHGSLFDPAPIDDSIDQACTLLTVLKPNSRFIAKRPQRALAGGLDGTECESKKAPVGSHKPPIGSPDGTPVDLPSGSQEIEIGKGIEEGSFPLREKEPIADASPLRPAERPARRKPPRRRHPFPDQAFEVWYAGYPHKVGRGAAEKAFEKVRVADETAFDEMISGRDDYVRTKPADRPWCNPATWLNEKRWLDRPAGMFAPSAADCAASSTDPRVDLGGGLTPTHSAIRSVWSKHRWPDDWGPKPDEPGCQISRELMSKIMEDVAGNQVRESA